MYSDAYVKRYQLFMPLLILLQKPRYVARFIMLAKACLTCNAYEELDKIKCPVFVIGGQQDKVVYVRNKNKRNEYLGLISTDVSLSETEIIRIYGKRWDIEVFFKVCKSYLNLSKECRAMSCDAMTAHTAIVFTRYRCFPWRTANQTIHAFQMILQMFRTVLADQIDLSDEKIDELVDAFTDAIPALLRSKLQAA